MKVAKATVFALAVLLGVMASAAAWAQHRHHHRHGGARFGLFIGAPAFWYGSPYYYNRYPNYYYNPYPYYYPGMAVVPAAPTVYVEQGQPEAAPAPSAPAPASSYWYFCRESGAYYPYVNECAGQWERIAPRPPS